MFAYKATLKSYLDQWDRYFQGTKSKDEFLSRLRGFAFDGELRSCNFRSVCWRIFLGCLPPDIEEWENVVRKSRAEYEEIKNKHVTKPTHETEGKNLDVENPLSQNDARSWKKFFKNSELKTTIHRDVRRTFPEMEYFHNENVHELLVNVLFCYAREHTELSYRQGMHELLAPLVFIIHCDLQAACHAREIEKLPDSIETLLNTEYLEHDAYCMFCKLMESTNAWYAIRTPEECRVDETDEKENEIDKENENLGTDPKPFQPQEIATGNGPTLAITNKLNHIHNTLLVQHDLQLHTHLNRLEIIPQVFGLRWIRLLFGREFSLQDLLVLWDAIFADSHTLDLVDYLFVAMLVHIRNHLLNADYSLCMQTLMKYPPVDDINDIVKAAKDIRVMKERSFSDTLMENSSHHPLDSSNTQRRKISASKMVQPGVNKQNTITKLFKDLTRKVIPANTPTPPPHSSLDDPTYAGHSKSPMMAKQSGQHTRTLPTVTKTTLFKEAPKPEEMHRKNPSQLEEEVSDLHFELDKLRQMCIYCSDKIAASVTILQSNVRLTPTQNGNQGLHGHVDNGTTENCEQKTFEREQILLAVASLKQVRDLLQGSLTFNPNLREYHRAKKTSESAEPEPGANGEDLADQTPSSTVNVSAIVDGAGDT